MFQTRRMNLILVMAGALLLLAPLSRVAWAQNTYNSTYFNTFPTFVYPLGLAPLPTTGTPLPATDNTIREANPTFHTNSIVGIDTNDVGGLCAMNYVYDDDEQPIECCGCPITNDGVITLSVEEDLTSNPFGGAIPLHGTIHVVSADPNAPAALNFCDPTGTISPIVLDPTIREWITHVPLEHVGPTPYPIAVGPGIINITETEFLPNNLAAHPLALEELEADCAFIRREGSGTGVCTCSHPEPPTSLTPTPPGMTTFG